MHTFVSAILHQMVNSNEPVELFTTYILINLIGNRTGNSAGIHKLLKHPHSLLSLTKEEKNIYFEFVSFWVLFQKQIQPNSVHSIQRH